MNSSYHFFEIGSGRYRAWERAGQLYVEAITRLGIRPVTDPTVRRRAAEVIAADRAWAAAQKGERQ